MEPPQQSTGACHRPVGWAVRGEDRKAGGWEPACWEEALSREGSEREGSALTSSP